MTITIPWWFVYLLCGCSAGYAIFIAYYMLKKSKDDYEPEDWK